MAQGINLHNIANSVISGIHPNRDEATLYQSIGQTYSPSGEVKAVYAEGVTVYAQFQSESPTTLFHADKVGQENISRKVYINSPPDFAHRIASLARPLSRNGDFIKLKDDTYWLIDSVIEDFSLSGWVCVRATLQTVAPDFSYSDWEEVTP